MSRRLHPPVAHVRFNRMEPTPPTAPTGLVTLVFTDIEGSSDLWQQFGPAFEPVLDEHNRLMREAAARWHGFEVKTVGDAFFLTFAQASAALRFALDAQIAFASCAWDTLLPGLAELRVRMGMHTGEPILSQHPGGAVDYFGPAVNRAARVGGAGHGGQVIVSEVTRALAATDLPPDTGFLDHGPHRLKGVGEERLWQLLHPGLRVEFPPLTTLHPARHNLPPAASPYIGREVELAKWEALVRDPTVRLLSLLGFGGMGKTRTALQLGELVHDAFEHGVWWVELAEARDVDGAVQRVALALRLALQKETPIRDQIRAFLKERSLLLILDNVEQIDGVSGLVAELLGEAPGLKILVTSRRALEIRPERRIELDPLAASEAERLFVESARSRSDGFDLGDENRADVTELCRRLEGVPLAIELAASRIAGLTPREMLERLNQQFRLLQTRAPDLPPRQRALRGAIDWSYDLLHEEERELFAQLAVFAGGFDMHAAEHVCETFDVFEGVMELRKHSLLRAETDPETQATRFSMLVSVRSYAQEKLEGGPEAGSAYRQRHAEHYLHFVEAWLRAAPAARGTRILRSELDNLRTALAWWEEHGPADLCARLAAALYQPLYRLGLWPLAGEALRIGREAAATFGPAADPLRADLETSTAALLDDLGDPMAAQEHVALALELRRRMDDLPALADTLNIAGLIAQHRNDSTAAERIYREALSLVGDDPAPRARLLHNLAYVESGRGNLEAALAGFTAAAAERRRAGDARSEAETVMMLGVVHHLAARHSEAGEHYRAALPAFRQAGDRYWEAVVLHNLGELEHDRGAAAEAVPYFTAAERIFGELQARQAEESRAWLQRLEALLGAEEFSAAQTTLAV